LAVRGARVFDLIGEVLNEADECVSRWLPTQFIRASHYLGGFGLPRRLAGEGFDDCGLADQIGLERGETRLLSRIGGRRQFLLEQGQQCAELVCRPM
jgi:hypothetical protein